MTYFELFDIPVQLKVNTANLSRRFFELSKQFHPDYFATGNKDVQEESLEKSALLNKAWKTFQSPDATIKYVLQEKGLMEEEEKYQLPPDFLMDMMEMNEKLLEEDPDDFRKEVEGIAQSLYDEIKNIVENYDDVTVSTDDLLKIKEYYFKKKYLYRILDRLDD